MSEFLEIHQKSMEQGFWTEEYRITLLNALTAMYKTEVIRNWAVVDIVSNGDKFLVKWSRRFIPLTDEQLKEDWGRQCLSHTKEFGIYHWDTFDNTTILMHEADNLIEAMRWVLGHYQQRIHDDGADQVDIVNSNGVICKKISVK